MGNGYADLLSSAAWLLRDAGHAIGNSHNADAAAPNQRGSGELSAVPVLELLGLNHGGFIGKRFAR